MPTYRYPVLVWPDSNGAFTAALVEDPSNVVSVDRTPEEALDKLSDWFAWRQREGTRLPPPDFQEPRLLSFAVAVRPEHREGDRVYPCDEPVTLHVACVSGRHEGGLLVAALPTLGLRFHYHAAEKLRDLVNHYVQDALRGRAPAVLAQFLAPTRLELRELPVRVARREDGEAEAAATPALTAVAEPLGDAALRRRFARAWGRDAEVADLVHRLGRERANVVLVGEPGAGKTSILVDAVRKLERTAAPEDDPGAAGLPAGPSRRRFWLTRAARLIAGAPYLGQWEERCEAVIEELAGLDGVLCVESLLDLVRLGGRGPGASVAAFLAPYVARGELRLVAEATPAELDACRRLLPGLADLFSVLAVHDFDRAGAIAVLDRVAAASAQNRHLDVERGLVDLVYRLFRRFAPYPAFPGQAAAFVLELCERAARRPAEAGTVARVTAADAIAAFVRRTGLPELFLRDELPLAPAEVLAAFRAQVIGQEEGCQAAAALVTTFKAGLADPHRPLGVCLFCGPTGVGKTELAKALARYFFGHGEGAGERLVRLDMSEFAGADAADRLLGDPDGAPGDLIQRVRRQPFAVILLDEIEKAAPEVFDCLLGVFDEGRLTDRYGRVTRFTSTVIVMTSNLGAGAAESLGFGPGGGPAYAAEAQSFFRPEFFNRIDAVVTFRPLAPESVRRIAEKELGELARREGLARARLTLTWTDRLVAWLAREGFDRRYGARPLQRTIERRVVTPLARWRVAEGAAVRDAEIRMDAVEGGDSGGGAVRFEVRGA